MASGHEQLPVDTERSRTEKLKALVRKDINDEITAMAEEALRRRQEDGEAEAARMEAPVAQDGR